MGIKKQLNVRIPLELQEKIDNDGKPKVEIVIEALELYFASKKQPDDSNKGQSANINASQNDSNNDSNIKKSENKSNDNDSKISISDSNNSNNDSNSSNNNSNSSNNNSSNNNSSNNNSNSSKMDQIDSNEVSGMKGEIEFLRAKIDDLLKLLHQEQVLHIQTQRMLTSPPPVQKKWWQFWN